jgi:hypothetical protein
MPLFNDPGLIGIADLEIYEANLSKIASTHNINLESKTAITIAQVGDRILSRLIRSGSVNARNVEGSLGFARPISALPPPQRWSFTLSNVVVTAPLQRWMCYQVLAQAFSEAYSAQLNDRFRSKWNEYTALAQEAETSFYDLGIGVVSHPLPKPATPNVSIISGPAPAGLIVVQAAWTDANGFESSLSDYNPVALPDGSSIVVGMPEPAGQVPVSAAGWNVYIGANGGDPSRQNLTPIDINTTWSLPNEGFLSGPAPMNGQQPDWYIIDSQRLQRG